MTGKQRIKQQGFSLLELLVVLVIIALLAGLVGPRLFGQADKAKQQTANTQVKMLKGALETLYLDIGRFPTSEEGLALLVTQPAASVAGGGLWKGPYLDEAIPVDPWGTAYHYEFIGQAQGIGQPFYLYSFGSDTKQGGDGNGKDIGYLPK